MNPGQSVPLRLELERVSLLYKQNIMGVSGLLLFAILFSGFCRNLLEPGAFFLWIFVVVLSAAIRIEASRRWRKKKAEIQSLNEIKKWHFGLKTMIFSSGMIWGFAGWVGSQSPDPTQQIVTAMTVIFMSAGAIVCWAPSLNTMFTFLVPSIVPWVAGYLFSDTAVYQAIGVIGILYVLLGSRAGTMLSRFIERSLKLNIENMQLANELQQEILIKDQAEESLRIALSSSDAIEWRWNVEQDIFTYKGDLFRSLGIRNSQFQGSLDEVAELFYHDDKEKFRASLLRAALKGGDIDIELRISWPNQVIRDLGFRGKAQSTKEGKITHLTGIAWDATAQKSQAKLQQEKDIHEAANRAKSIFLANASHEIRTPLAVINGYADNLLANSSYDDQLKTDLQIISRNGKFLSSLVNDFLDLAKIESGQFYIEKSGLSPRQEIEEAFQLVQPLIYSKGLKFEVHYESILPVSIESDASRIRQIIVNILTNAANFTDKGLIQVRISHDVNSQKNGFIRIRIQDSGIGMDEKTKKQLFEPFMRGQSVEVQKVYGSGLGLALSRNLAQNLGGDIKLLHSAPGSGSVFEFSFSTGPLHRLSFPKNERQENSTQKLTGLRILVVDDAIDLRVLMRRNLERKGAEVETAENGLDAVEKIQTQSFDVILMDIKMPVMDGHEASATIRKLGFDKPLIAITAHASEEDRQKSFEVGCDNYLSKPVDFNTLIETILSSLQRNFVSKSEISSSELRI